MCFRKRSKRKKRDEHEMTNAWKPGCDVQDTTNQSLFKVLEYSKIMIDKFSPDIEHVCGCKSSDGMELKYERQTACVWLYRSVIICVETDRLEFTRSNASVRPRSPVIFHGKTDGWGQLRTTTSIYEAEVLFASVFEVLHAKCKLSTLIIWSPSA
jgi:hypothetical protein